MGKRDDWVNNSEYVKLSDFLVEKTKNSKEVLSILGLTKEFQRQNKTGLAFLCVQSRIRRLRSVIHKMSHLDTETKVKLMFGLSGSVDYGFLRELRKEAEVKVDDSNRILHYKKNGGGLELKGEYRRPSRIAEASYKQILEFLAKKVEKTNEVFSIADFCKEFKSETDNSHNEVHLQARIREARNQIYESELFDEDMKIRMMFATGTAFADYALEELRKNATVVVDEKNIIKEYKKNDGSLNLKRDDIRRIVSRKKGKKPSAIKSDYVEDSDDEAEETEKVKTRSGRVSKRNFSDVFFYEHQKASTNIKLKNSNTPTSSIKKRKISDQKANSVEKKKKKGPEKKAESMAPKTKSKKMKAFDEKKKTTRGRKKTEEEELDSESEEDLTPKRAKKKESGHSKPRKVAPKKKNDMEIVPDYDYSIDIDYQFHDNNRADLEPIPLRDNNDRDDFVEEIPPPIENLVVPNDESRVKLEPFDGPLKMDMTRGAVINDGDDYVEEIATSTFVAPKYNDIKIEEPDIISLFDPIDIIVKSEEIIPFEQRDRTISLSEDVAILQNPPIIDIPKDSKNLTLILEALDDFIDILDSPILSDLQKNIKTKLEACKDRNETVSNKQIQLSLEICLIKVTKPSQSSEDNESMSLKEFLGHFRHALKAMKCSFLIDFDEKLMKMIRELRVKDQNISVEVIRNAIQNFIDNIITS